MDISKINNLIATHEKRLATLKSLKGLIESDPDLASEVMQAFASTVSPPLSASPTSAPKKTRQYDRMVEFMKDGEWRSLTEIADGIGVSKTSIAPYLYHDGTKDKFESRKHPERPRMRQWRLKQPDGPGETP